MNGGETLKAGYKKTALTVVKGKRTHEMLSLKKTEVSPGDTYYVPIPSLSENQCIIPDTMKLSYKFVNSNTKSCFLNNLGKLLCQQLSIQVNGEIVYDNTGKSILQVYKDFWLSSEKRENMVEYGIANENIRKILSKDDNAVTSNKTDDVLLAVVFTRQKMKLGQILRDHGPFAPYNKNSFEYRITLPAAGKIMKAQSGESVGEYKLEDIRFEYETIESKDLVNEVNEEFEVGRSFAYDYTTLLTTLEWRKDTTKENISINIPRKSMTAVVLLFKKQGSDDSEEFYNANIDKIDVTVEGISNSVYSKGLLKSELYNEASGFFGIKDDDNNDNVSCLDFYKNRYSVVIYLRAVDDDSVYGSGRKLLGTQSGILLEISKKATTHDLQCYVFVISDGLINFVDKKLQEIYH